MYELATWDGTTPLMDAAKTGKVAEVQILLDAAADPTLRNRQGLIALDVAWQKFGGAVPRLLQQLLTSELSKNARPQ